MDTAGRKPRKALVLPGAGARGAYQVGVLKAINDILPTRSPNPFPIICGTSAGAINAGVLASRSVRFDRAVAEMEQVWANFRTAQVYRSDTAALARTSLRWLATMAFAGFGVRSPVSLLDNTPLRNLLCARIPPRWISRSIERGYLDALAVTASGYSSAQSITFFQSRQPIQPWVRARRAGRPADIGIDHLLASAAVPFVFPPVRLGGEYYGDGSMRNRGPLSPAVHLGADRILVIGGRDEQPELESAPDETPTVPTIGQLGGYMLDTLFLDGLYSDLERVTRINSILAEVGEGRLRTASHTLRRLETLIVLPSADMRTVAARHVGEMPRALRLLLSRIGSMNHKGMQLVSYLLFESGYTRELIELGYQDAMVMRDELEAFLFDQPVEAMEGPAHLKDQLRD